MKNCLLGFLMLFVLNAFTQSTHTINFEPGGTGSDWVWVVTENADNPPLEFVANPDNSGINTSATTAKFITRATGNPWALCFTDGDGVFTFDATNAIVKIMVYKPTISNIGFKFEGMSGAHEILVPNTLINQWEEITFDFSSKIGSTYNRIVIIPDFTFGGRPTDNVLYFDNIQVPDGFTVPPLAEPTTVPPVPAHAAENVLSVYTEVYPNIPGTNFNPNWGQSTAVTVNFNAAGNNTLKYANLNYQGTQLVNQNVSGYEFIHVDFWTPNSTVLNFFLISPGNEKPYPLPITAETWVSVDIPLSYYVPPVNLADVFQFKVDGNGTVYFDNWYFWKNPAGALTDATLSDMQVDGVTVPGFAPGIFSYDVELPLGTTVVPAVTATTTNPAATFVVNDALALPGTTEVVVTAEDGVTMQTYAVNFTVAGSVPTSDYCETLVYHFGIAAEVPSSIYLTIKNLDALSMIVEIESATTDPVDLLLVTGGSGAAISAENTSVPGKISRILSWTSNPPENVTLNILWSKASFPGNWMLIQGEFTVPFEAGCEPAGPAAITFRVDMSEYAGAFTNVYVSGSFNGWSGNANQLLDPDMNGVYEAELLLEDGNYEYKFTLDNWSVQEEFQGSEPCVITLGGYHNRALSVTGTTTLPLVCWNSCNVCGYVPPSYDVTFQVNMSQYAGTFTNVYLSGSMNGWCGNCNQLTDANLDGIYDITLNLAEGNYKYKFTLDNWAGQEEFIGGEPCVINLSGYNNRYISIQSNTTTPAFCWNSCEPCVVLPVYYDVTFQVDMSQYAGTYSQVDLNGSFNGWCGSCNPLTDANADNIYETTLSLVEGTTYQYKFTLDGWNTQEMFVGGESCTSTIGGYTNRTLYVYQTTILPVVCWNSCDACPTYQAGWVGISSNVMPENKISLEELFAPIVDDMIILLSQTGIFWPSQNINTIGEWDTYQGYKAKFSKGVIFEFSGAPLTNRTVTFAAGIHLLPVLSEGIASVEDVIVPLGNAVEFMFDLSTNGVYWPAGGIVPGVTGALETLNPGFAYLIRLTTTTTIDFGTAPKNSGYTSSQRNYVLNTTPWNDVQATGAQHILSVNTSSLLNGDFVGVFNLEGTCTGLAQYNGGNTNLPLIVVGNDITTPAKDGMNENETMLFQIYRNGHEMEVNPAYDAAFSSHDGLFVENGLSVITGFKFGATGIFDAGINTLSIYPNPNNGHFMLLNSNEDDCEFVIVNIRGQQIYSGKVNGSATLDLSDQSKGVYFIRMSNSSSTSVEKIIIE